jgi:polysaccharide export outer membrane protein
MSRIRFLAPALLSVLMAGCAYAPGMYLGRSNLPERSAAEVEAEAVTPTPLSWQLVRSLEAADVQTVPALPQGQPSEYRIGPNDALRITVWNHPDLNLGPTLATTSTLTTGGVVPAGNVVPHRVVSHDGTIYFPLVGKVKAAGLTASQLRDQLAKRLSKLVTQPQVEVEIGAFRSQRVFLVGELNTPGNQAITDVPMRIADAIGLAGGHTPNADLSSVTVTRGNERYTVDLERLYYDGDMSRNMLLKHGDVVTVPDRRERKVFVMGEVMKPTSYILPRGRTTLAEALSDAGGPNPLTSHTGQVFVLRAGTNGSEQPDVFQLDARSPEALILADSFVLRPRDVVYVDPTQLTRLGRLLAQVLPWLQQGSMTSRNLSE